MANPTKTARKSHGPRKGNNQLVFCTEYRHKWTGKLMRAADYGYKAWPLWVKTS